jgi:hypothetical protein
MAALSDRLGAVPERVLGKNCLTLFRDDDAEGKLALDRRLIEERLLDGRLLLGNVFDDGFNPHIRGSRNAR